MRDDVVLRPHTGRKYHWLLFSHAHARDDTAFALRFPIRQHLTVAKQFHQRDDLDVPTPNSLPQNTAIVRFSRITSARTLGSATALSRLPVRPFQHHSNTPCSNSIRLHFVELSQLTAAYVISIQLPVARAFTYFLFLAR
jgi:hypothetical protein